MFVGDISCLDLSHGDQIGKQIVPLLIGHRHQALQVLCHIVEPPNRSRSIF